MPSIPEIRMFISSPGDVAHERRICRNVIQRLQVEFAGLCNLQDYFWEYEPFEISKSFQEQIPSPESFDLMICILWSRLGSRLHSSLKLPDGRPAQSGTEYEIEYALHSQRQRKLPEFYLWINTTPLSVVLSDEEKAAERLAQYRALRRFIDQLTIDPEENTFVGSFSKYESLGQFEDLLEVQLRKVLERRLASLPDAPRPGTGTGHTPAPPLKSWREGSPFRSLEAFEFQHAPIFFGRTTAIGNALNQLRANTLGAEPQRSFLLVIGASGSGKSSLAQAGLLPSLTEPGVLEGVGFWRYAITRPSAADGNIFKAFATALLSETALPELRTHGFTVEKLEAEFRKDGLIRPQRIESGLLLAAERVRAKDMADTEELTRRFRSEGRENDALELEKAASGFAPKARLAILVDQMEEIFSGAPAAQLHQFAESLKELAGSGCVTVIATMRSDFYHKLAANETLLELARDQGTFHLAAPSHGELGQMIRKPASAAGLRFEVDPTTEISLDEELRDAASGDPRILPLLEFTLGRLYELCHPGGLLTWAAYRGFKGLYGALEQHADEVLAQFPQDQHALYLEEIFGKLVTFVQRESESGAEEEGETLVRSTVPRTDLVTPHPESPHSAQDLERFVEAFTKARLLVSRAEEERPDHVLVTIVHESLLTRWSTLNQILGKNKVYVEMRTELLRSQSAWAASKENSRLIPEGKSMARANQLLAERPHLVSADLREYIQRSRRHWSMVALRWRLMQGGLVAAVLATIAVVWWNATKEAQNRALLAAETEKAALQADLNANLRGSNDALQALNEYAFQNYRQAILSARRATEIHNTGPALGALIRTVSALPDQLVVSLQFTPDNPANRVAISNGGVLLAAGFQPEAGDGGMRRQIRVFDLNTQNLLATLPASSEEATIISLGWIDDARFYAFERSGLYREWTLADLTAPARERDLAAPSVAAQVAVGGTLLAAASQLESEVLLVALAQDAPPLRVALGDAGRARLLQADPTGEPHFLALTENSHLLLITETGAQPIQVLDRRNPTSLAWEAREAPRAAIGFPTGEVILNQLPSSGPYEMLHKVPGSQFLTWNSTGTLAGAQENKVHLSQPLVGNEYAGSSLAFGMDHLMAVSWSADGNYLVTGDNKGVINIYTPSQPGFEGLGGAFEQLDMSVGFHGMDRSRDGRLLAAGSTTGEIFVWNYPERDLLVRVPGHSGTVNTVAWSPDGKWLASAGQGGNVLFTPWEGDGPSAAPTNSQPTITHQGEIWTAAWFPDSRTLATASHDNTVRLWDAETGATAVLGTFPDYAVGLAISPDGKTLAATSTHGEIWFWEVDLATWQTQLTAPISPRLQLEKNATSHEGTVCALDFHPDGTLLVSSGNDGGIRLWNAQAGALLHATEPLGKYMEDVEFSPDGTQVAAVDAEGFVHIWSTADLAPVLSYQHSPHHAWNVEWSADSKYVISATNSASLPLLNCQPEVWKKRAASVIGPREFRPTANK